MELENELRSARGPIIGSFVVVMIAAGLLIFGGDPVQSGTNEDATPPKAQASPVVLASPVPEVFAVDIAKLTYRPFRLVVPTGSEVAWTNFDGVPHTVTARDLFDSGRIDQQGVFKQTFDDTGEFWYECLFHKDMVAVVEVVEQE